MGGAGRSKSDKNRRWFIRLMIASALCLLIPRRFTDKIDLAFAGLLKPITSSSNSAALAVSDTVTGLAERPVSSEQYRRLEQAYLQLEQRFLNLSEQLRQEQALTRRLAGIEGQFGPGPAQLIAAQVIGADASAQRQILVLDRGTQQQVRPEQLVLAAETAPGAGEKPEPLSFCVVGKILSAGARQSRLQLITDPEFSLKIFIAPAPARKGKWQAPGVLKGIPMNGASITLSTVHPVQVGDSVFAALNTRTLPAPVLAGKVATCRRDEKEPVMWRISLAPALELNRLEQVVIVNVPQVEK